MRRIAAEDNDENAADRMVINYGSAVSYHTNVNDKWRDLASRTMRPLCELDEIAEWLEGYLKRSGIATARGVYSKLSFLKDTVRAAGSRDKSGEVTG